MQLPMTTALGWILGGLLLPPLMGLWLFPSLTRALLSDLRVPRILHFAALGGLGMALRLRETGISAETNWAELTVQLVAMIVVLAYAAVFAIVTNNLEDLEADRISNPDRPLVRGSVDKQAYLLAGIAAQVLALVFALLFPCLTSADPGMEPELFLGILAISVGYYVYSCRPFRLKRVPIVAKLVIGFNSWVVAVCGYALAGGDWQQFPWIWSLFILLPLAFAANFIDLKDTEGDRATGVATLPVLLGEVRARHVIALATLATYVMGGVLLGVAWVYPLNAVAAIAHIYLLYRQPYDERGIFLVLLGSLLGLDIFLIWA